MATDLSTYKLPYSHLREGLESKTPLDIKSLAIDGLTLLALTVSLVVIFNWHAGRAAVSEAEVRLATYEQQEGAWVHCLNGGKVDLGDEILDCSTIVFRRKK